MSSHSKAHHTTNASTMANSGDGSGNYRACPPILVRLPGDGLVEGTTLTPIDEGDETQFNEDRLRRLEADSVIGIPCDLLPDHFRDEFLSDDVIFFRRSSDNTTSRQGSGSHEINAQLSILLATWMNLLSSVILIVFLSSFPFVYQAASVTLLGLYGLFAACLAFRFMALLTSFLLLLHHRARSRRAETRYDELCTTSPLLYYLVPASDRSKVSSAILDAFNFIDSVLFDATESALTETVPLIGNPIRYAPLSAVDRQQLLDNGWLILQLTRYPDPFTSCWFPMRGLSERICHVRQDWRRYKAAAVVYRALEENGSVNSGIAVLEYSVKRIEWESQQPRSALIGFHFIPKFAGAWKLVTGRSG